MKNVMEILGRNLRKAFPKMPEEIFVKNEVILTESYSKKCESFFDLDAMYTEGEEAHSPEPLSASHR